MNQQPVPEKKINEIRMTVWVGVVAIIVICLLTFVYMVFVGQKKSGNQNNNINTSTAIDISNWLTYTDSQYSFQFKYPSDWTLIEEGIIGLSYNDNYYIYVTHQGKNAEDLTLGEWLKQVKGLSEDYGYELKYDEKTGITLEGLNPGIYQGAVTLYFMNNYDVFGIEWFDSEKKDIEVFQVFNQILLSFEFNQMVADSRCNDWEAGLCEAVIFPGYYYSSTDGLCHYSEAGSGCSSPPFETLEECQAVCIDGGCTEEYCSQFTYGNCPGNCQTVCVSSYCDDSYCTDDCGGPGSCYCN